MRAKERSAHPLFGFLLLLLVGTGCGKSEPPDPIHPRAAYYLSEAQRALDVDAYRPALMLVDSAAAYAPERPDLHFTRGRIWAAMEHAEEAAAAYQRALDFDPSFQAARFNLANTAYRREQYRTALAHYRVILEALRRAPETVALYQDDPDGREAHYAVLLQVGRAYAQLGVADSARLAYEQAVEVAAEKPEAYEALGRLLAEQGDLEAALAQARHALARAPEDPEPRYRVGALLVRLQRHEDALPYLEAVVAQDPHHRGAHYNLGQALVHLQRTAEAEHYLTRADSLQQAEAALGDLAETARVNPDAPQAWVDYGNALRRSGRGAEAREAYRKALNLAPWSLALQNNLAVLAVEQGDTARAVARYRMMLRQDSTLSDIWLNLGTIHAQSGDTDAARRAWRQALRFDPDHATARAYLAQLPAE